MNIFNKITLQSLKKNRTRSIVTIIGIILSSAMICAVTTFASSIYNYIFQNTLYEEGDWHGCAHGIDRKIYENINNDSQISKTVYAQQIGYSKLENCKNENKPYLFVIGVSENFSDMMPVHLTKGRLPNNSDEIIIPDHLYSNGKVEYSIGDTITLALGKRILDDVPLYQNSPFYSYDEQNNTVPNKEELIVNEKRTYKIVGFYKRPNFEEYTAPGYTAITTANASKDYSYNVYFKMNKPKNVYSFIKYLKNNHINAYTNNELLKFYGLSIYDGFNSMVTGLIAIIIALIIFGSVSLIYNAFSISVSERTKQFGLLASVGATKKQMRKMVIAESLMLSAVGIPIGILSGIGGISITLLIIGNKFNNLFGNYSIPLRVNVSLISIIIAIIIALLTVLISAVIPSKRAAKVSAIEAIRQNRDINIKIKKVKTSKFTYKLFGLPGVLAKKYYKRSRKKYKATILSLFMSIVLFVSAAAFTNNLSRSVDESLGAVKYDIVMYGFENHSNDLSDPSSFNELLSEVKKDKGVKNAAYSLSNSFMLEIDTKYVNSEFTEYFAKSNNIQNSNINSVNASTNIQFIDDISYKELLKNYNLDEAKYLNSKKPVAIAFDKRVMFDNKIGKYTSYNIFKSDDAEIQLNMKKHINGYYLSQNTIDENGNKIFIYENEKTNSPNDQIILTEDEATINKTLSIGKIIYDTPFFINSNSRLTLLYPYSLRNAILPSDFDNSFIYKYYITTDTHEQTHKAIEKALVQLDLDEINVIDYAADKEDQRNMIIIIQTFSYGFIILISLIAAANVFNTISTNISLRRREFAMLKSIGMTEKSFNKMMNFECLIYGTKALLLGLPVSIGISFLIHLAISEGYETQFIPPWTAILVAVISVFAVVFVTMIYSMSKIKKDNPIDALKNENL